MDQHVDITTCAHVACWAVLRHYSENYSEYREYLVHDIAKLATGFEPGGISPSRGLDEWEAERVFNAAGCFPVIVSRDELTDDEFFGQLLAYLESGFPLFIGMDLGGVRHAICRCRLQLENAGGSAVGTGQTTCGAKWISC